jgi:hypothetical protein
MMSSAPTPELIEFAKALARAAVSRDIAAARAANDSPKVHAHSHLRSLQQR